MALVKKEKKVKRNVCVFFVVAMTSNSVIVIFCDGIRWMPSDVYGVSQKSFFSFFFFRFASGN